MKLPKKIAGISLRWELILVAIVIGTLATCHIFGGCLTQEGMSVIGQKMSTGVHNDTYQSKHDSLTTNGGGPTESPSVPLPEGQLFMWANNDFTADCCGTSNVSGTGGCACITKEQWDYLSARAGNATKPAEF